jgi:hypothetical protein
MFWQRCSMADIPLCLGYRTVPRPQPQQFSANSNTTATFKKRFTPDWASLCLWRRWSLPILNSTELLSLKLLKLCFERWLAGQFVLVSDTHPGAHDQIFITAGHLQVFCCGVPSWWEDRSLMYSYNCFWAMPAQSLLGPSPAELMTIYCCLIWDSPNMEGQVTVFISPPRIGWSIYTLRDWALFCCL